MVFGSPLFLSVVCVYLREMEKDKSQLDRFKEAARELGADDDEAKFNEKLGKLVKQKPSPENSETET